VEIVDSRLASIPLGLVALSAAERVAEGDSPHDVAVQARRDSKLTNSFFAVDTLEYLQKGGRIGKAQSFLGSMLNVKPILTLQDGEAHPLERVRNSSRAVRRLVELTRLEAPLRKLAVIYSTEPQQAQGLMEDLSGLLAIDDITVARFGATLGTYLGPRALGVGFTRAGDVPRA
jgi:DegV family protein with EDD domain